LEDREAPPPGEKGEKGRRRKGGKGGLENLYTT